MKGLHWNSFYILLCSIVILIHRVPFYASTVWTVSKYGVFFWSVFSCVQSEYRKIWTRKNSLFGHFSGSDPWNLISHFNVRNFHRNHELCESLPQRTWYYCQFWILREKCPNAEFFSGPYFPVFGLSTERYSVYFRIQSEWGEIRTKKNSVFGYFSRSGKAMTEAVIIAEKIFHSDMNNNSLVFNYSETLK